MRVKLSILAAAVCTVLAAIPLTAANTPAAKTNAHKTAASTPAEPTAWPPETLSGKITMVNPAQKLVVVETPDGVPFDLVVTPKTRIRSGDRVVTLKDLTQDKDKPVSVRFTPERRGDVAGSIQING